MIYGSLVGLATVNNRTFTQDSAGIEDTAEAGDQVGVRATSPDFNGDGYDDVAVAAWSEDIGTATNAGAVHVFYGSANGLTGSGDRLFHQDTAGMRDSCEFNDAFGLDLASGDFNGDGYADLAVGVSQESIGSVASAGGVLTLFGSATGITEVGNQFWSQNSSGIQDTSEASDRFGRSLSAGDYNGDGIDDLAIGVPFESVGGILCAGVVHVLYGWIDGLGSANNQLWVQQGFVPGDLEQGDGFGDSLTTGDFNGDGYDDMVIGVPNDDIGSIRNAGAVNVIYGSRAGLSNTSEEPFAVDTSPLECLGMEPQRAGDFIPFFTDAVVRPFTQILNGGIWVE